MNQINRIKFGVSLRMYFFCYLISLSFKQDQPIEFLNENQKQGMYNVEALRRWGWDVMGGLRQGWDDRWEQNCCHLQSWILNQSIDRTASHPNGELALTAYCQNSRLKREGHHDVFYLIYYFVVWTRLLHRHRCCLATQHDTILSTIRSYILTKRRRGDKTEDTRQQLKSISSYCISPASIPFQSCTSTAPHVHLLTMSWSFDDYERVRSMWRDERFLVFSLSARVLTFCFVSFRFHDL